MTGPMGDTAPNAAPVARREANKREKLLRIRKAAREVFLQKGFDAATVREIAAAAEVAFGTLFLYARDKQDLLLLIFEEDLPAMRAAALTKATPDLPFVDQLVQFFAEFYRAFESIPQLSRDMLREVTFGEGTVAKRLRGDVVAMEQDLARLVARAQAVGTVHSNVAPEVAAHMIFALHRIELRACLIAEPPNIAASLAMLRVQFEILLAGLAAKRS